MPSLDSLFHLALYLSAIGVICWLIYRSGIPEPIKSIIVAVLCLLGIVWIAANVHIGNISPH